MHRQVKQRHLLHCREGGRLAPRPLASSLPRGPTSASRPSGPRKGGPAWLGRGVVHFVPRPGERAGQTTSGRSALPRARLSGDKRKSRHRRFGGRNLRGTPPCANDHRMGKQTEMRHGSANSARLTSAAASAAPSLLYTLLFASSTALRLNLQKPRQVSVAARCHLQGGSEKGEH